MNKQVSEKELIELTRREESILQAKENYYNKTQSLLIETIKTIETLKEIEKEPKTTFFTIGLGVIIEAKIINVKKVKRTFAENGYVEENTKDTIKWLEKRKTNIENQLEKISKDITKSSEQLNNFINILRNIEEEKNKLYSKNIATK